MAERLPRQPELKDFQEYVQKATERNGQSEDTVGNLILLSEQLGYLAKAIRKRVGIAYDADSKIPKIDEALAGVFFSTLNLANHLGIDLEVAFRAREKRYRRRKNRLS